MSRLINWILAVFLPMILSHAGSAQMRLGFIGDGFTAGAGASGEVDFQMASLAKIFDGKGLAAPSEKNEKKLRMLGVDGPFQAPNVLWPSVRENRDPYSWVTKNFLHGVYSEYLNTPEYGWASLLGRSIGAEARNIYLAVDNSAKVADFPRLSDRLLNALGSELPNTLFVGFAAYDLCSIQLDRVTSRQSYHEGLVDGVRYILCNGKIPKGGVEIVLVSFLPLAQLLSSKDILEHKVSALGSMRSCRELRKLGFQDQQMKVDDRSGFPAEKIFMRNIMPPNPVRTCPSLFAHEMQSNNEIGIFSRWNGGERKKQVKSLVDQKVSFVATRVRQFQRATKEAARELSIFVRTDMKKSETVVIRYVDMSSIKFMGPDLAPDCFHLSLDGQIKVAKHVKDQLRTERLIKK